LLAEGEVVAALFVDVGQRALPRSLMGSDAPGAEWFEIARAIAQHASVAMENHQLRRSQQEEAYVSTALLQVVQATATRSDLAEVLGTIVRITPALVGVERCLILLWSSGQGTFNSAHSTGNPADPERAPCRFRFRPGEFPLLDAVRRSGQPVSERVDALKGTTPDGTPSSPGRAIDWLGLPPGYSGVVQALPLTVRGSFLGAMLVAQGDAPGSVAERRQEILAGIAGQAAIAILNDRLNKEMARRERLAQEMKLARDIQRNLMPKRLPDYRAWQLAATCRPAREVGGDFFDVVELSEGHLGLVVADVADKGMPAALFMANARAMVRALASYNDSPAAVLGLVNQLLLPDAHRGMFVTAFYAVLSTKDGAFSYCNAGHNPPFVWRRQVGDVERLRTGGTALGVLEKPRLEEHRAFLRPGDWLIIYTDGVTEAFSAESEAFYGEERLDAAIRANVTGRAQDLLEAIERSVADFVGDTPPSDDLTMLVIHHVESEPGVAERATT
jgi:serine phosphatase RsbU (regulator of sigma subunit)